jgi:hypothetical protein
MLMFSSEVVRARVVSKQVEKRKAIDMRHEQVEENDTGRRLSDALEAGGAIRRPIDRALLAFE